MEDDGRPLPAGSTGYQIGTAPIAEPEEVTDVSVEASSISLNKPNREPPTEARDEPDINIQFGPRRLYQHLRDVIRRRPLSNASQSLGGNSWWPPFQRNGHSRSGDSIDRLAPLRRYRNRLCPPFRVAEEESPSGQESEFPPGHLTLFYAVQNS